MKRFLAGLVLLLSLCGCMANDIRHLEYASSAFEAGVEGSLGGLEFTAVVKAGDPTDTSIENPPPRDIELTFLSPATLAGVRIVRREGRVSVSSGELSADGRDAAGWLAAAELLIPEGRITRVVRVTEDGARMTRVEIRQKDAGNLTIWIDNAGHPLRIVSNSGGLDTDLRVRAFTPEQ